jgi:capsular polysaccharide biosynthesis protein
MVKNINKKIQTIVKKIFQIIFILIYGRIKSILNPINSDKVTIKEVNKENHIYKIYIVNKGRLYTDTIDDTAVIIDNQILDGPSYQLRPDINNILSPRNNAKVNDNIVFTKGTPRIKKRINGSVISLLSGGGANANYFHWLYDVLPRLSLYEELNNTSFTDYLLVPDNKLHFQKDSLKILGFKKNQILSSKKYRHLISDEIYLTDHPYNITNNSEIDHEKIPSWISTWLKRKFLNKVNLNNNEEFDKIYIDRSNIETSNPVLRGVINEAELKAYLLLKNFKFIKLHEISFLDQIRIFNNAKTIIGLHGAGFANISFCKPKTQVIELRSIGAGTIIKNIALNNKLDYHSLVFKAQKFEDTHNGLFEISINDLKKLI